MWGMEGGGFLKMGLFSLTNGSTGNLDVFIGRTVFLGAGGGGEGGGGSSSFISSSSRGGVSKNASCSSIDEGFDVGEILGPWT